VPTYYYDCSNAATHARLLMSGVAAPALHDHHSLAAESKLQVHLLADMPPLQSPALEDAGQSYEQSAAESSAVDWNLLSSLLPAAQLNFHQPAASPSSSSANKCHSTSSRQRAYAFRVSLHQHSVKSIHFAEYFSQAKSLPSAR
jgi:hypothetical protein